jgi:hypothetical protein
MKTNLIAKWRQDGNWLSVLAVFLIGLAIQHQALAFTLEVVDGTGAPVTSYRWLLEENNTEPGIPGVPTNNTVSMIIHKSHAPVVANGSSATSSTTITPIDLTKRYMLSVLADGYQLGGANVAVSQTSVKVILNKHPIPTAQINVLVYNDNNTINNAPDAAEVTPPAVGDLGMGGFQIVLADFAGGPIMQDAFGNPLGTTYLFGPTGEPTLDASGAPVVDMMGDGFIYTDANGRALIKYLAMGKYGVQAIPPTGTHWMGGHGSVATRDIWHQTATIEGTPTIDAWVTADEPSIFMEGFGPGFYHAFFGFVDANKMVSADPTSGITIGQPTVAGNVTVTGTVRYNHFGRPPVNQQFVVGPPVAEAWVGLNELNAGGVAGRGLYITPCDPDSGSFSISNVPPGTYQLVTWDKPLDALFGFNTITVDPPAGGGVGAQDLGNVFSFRWFGTLEGSVFYDANQNGFRDPSEGGISQQAVNLRWRDGTVYMATVTDATGDYAMSEVFPFFKWLVAEVDFLRFKATGLTTVIDEGGGVDHDSNPLTPPIIPVDNGWTMPSEGVRNPQPQYATNPDGTINFAAPIDNPYTGNNLSRNEQGPVLTQGIHLFLNQNNRIDWGKINYGPGENGGISGIVGYQTTRAEEDPRNGVIDAWEPGVPRVQMALYQDANSDQIIDDLDGSGGATPADVDNYPLGWAEGTGAKGPEDFDHDGDGAFDPGDAIQIAWTDSWDDVTDGYPMLGALQPNPPVILGKPIIGSDNYATWNQVRPQVFDGGYAFTTYVPGGLASGAPAVDGLPSGNYIVQTFPPPGYLIQTEESMNVGFGDAYIPSKLALPPEIVGHSTNHVGDLTYLESIVPTARAGYVFTVPAELTLFPDQHVSAPFAGQTRPLADMKYVRVAEGKNTAADFHVYTEVPKATRVVGFVLNDLTAEFNAVSPIFGEKGSPGWLPISFRDWAGHEVVRTYSDEYGSYTALVPSTYTVNVPSPSGVAPNMLTMVLNDPTMPDPSNPKIRIPDPHYNPAFATTPWTLHYYPGTFLYADTPIVPIAGFVGGPNTLLDVEPPAGTPMIKSVEGSVDPAPGGTLRGAWVGNLADTVTITSRGTVNVPDPTSLGYGSGNTVPRDFGFGDNQGTGSVTFDGTPLTILAWSDAVITARLPGGLTSPAEGQLRVNRGNGMTTPIGVTVTYESNTSRVHFVTPVDPAIFPLGTPIQVAIDAAPPGDLVIVPPNSFGEYNENPILWKPLRLQGSGLGTIINANPNPATRLSIWHTKVTAIYGGDPFTANEAPGITVLGNGSGAFAANFAAQPSRIDGLQIKGSIAGGGILVYDQADNLRISNNRVIGNQGSMCGGISIGVQGDMGILYDNPGITIEYNQILQNGGVDGAGGIGINTGAEGYKVQNNYIMGNFTRASGGGIGHEGRSRGGLIANNVIAFNEVFYGVPAGAVVVSGDGGGIFIAGEIAPGGLSDGSGSVTIINNLIQGNLAGAGYGGGIRAAGVNGSDVGTPEGEYTLDIFNNIIVNNVAGNSGGGISLQDATQVRIIHNTIADNDSTATAQATFAPGQTDSTPQGAGIVSHMHSPLLSQLSGQIFCDPELVNNIVWHNRSFYWDSTALQLAPPPASPVYADLAVAPVGSGLSLSPVNCILSTDTAPAFVSTENTLLTAIVIDEAGNNISVRFTPTGIYTPVGAEQNNYHLTAGTTAGYDLSGITELAADFDSETRAVSAPDIGADEFGAITSIIPPVAPAITVPLTGPAAAGAAPPTTTPLAGAGVPPGPMVKPAPLNPDPGMGMDQASKALDPAVLIALDRNPTTDDDGDGTVDNDVDYFHFSASDGFATMGDGNVLYTFGFADMTGIMLDHVAMEGMLKANLAAPTMVLHEGRHAYLDVSNVGMMMRPDLFDPHTVHFHGFAQAASIYDGEPMASISVNMGATLRYYYQLVDPGTYLYHCHVEATEHMQMGMIGNLYVLPKQNHTGYGADPVGTKAKLAGGTGVNAPQGYAYNDGDGSTAYDVEAPLQTTGFDRNFHEQHIAVQPLPFAMLFDNYPMINGRGYPDTINTSPITTTITDPDTSAVTFQNDSQKVHALVTAQVGQRILLRLSNVSESDFITLTVLGLPMKVIAKDARLLRGMDPDGAGPLLGANQYYNTSSITLGGGETTDVILNTAGRSPGTYFIYSSRLNQLSNDEEDFGGLMTHIVLTP